MMDKKQLRAYYKKLRSILTPDEIEKHSLAIANQLLSVDVWNKTYYHLFLSITELNEINTEYILQILMGKDKEIVISKMELETRNLIHYLLTENTKIKKGKFNVPEPTDGIEVPVNKIEVVFIPLLAFDLKGNRVGYGKGFYDNFLSECNKDTLKVGLSFFEAEPQIDNVYKRDIPLDFCVTPQRIYKF